MNRSPHSSNRGVRAELRSALPNWPEALLLALCAGLLSLQLFVPPFIGLSNNGDFPKVTGLFSLGPKYNGWVDNFFYFTSEYVYDPSYYWNSGVYSSEQLLAWAASTIGKLIGKRGEFDIRFMGAVHVLLFLGAYYTLLLALRRSSRLARYGVAVIVLAIFTDVNYVSYFNSFYTDTAALLGLFLMVAMAFYIVMRDAVSAGPLVLFGAAALLFITSKAQHGILGFVPAAFVLVSVRLSKRPQIRYLGGLLCALLLAASTLMLLITPRFYKGQALFNLVFVQIAPKSAAPLEDLNELGLNESDLCYVGMNAFQPDSPVNDEQWASDFYARSGYSSVARFYMRHPSRALGILQQDLHEEAYRIRPWNLANTRRVDGHPPGTLTDRFAAWSNLRSSLFSGWPAHIIVWYLLLVGGSVAVIYRDPSRTVTAVASICLVVAGMAIFEFCFASLADATETYRHLFLFHAMTDLTVCFAVAGVMVYGRRRGLGRRPGG